MSNETMNKMNVVAERFGSPLDGVREDEMIGQPDLAREMSSMLKQSAVRHHHLCPRQVLGVRIGLAGARAVGMEVPREDKRLLVFVETDGCFISGVEAATGCCVNRRTMRILDYGKIAAVFVNVITGETVRVAPHLDVRHRVWDYAPPGETRHYFAMLHGYQRMPEEELVVCQDFDLPFSLSEIVSRPGARANCEQCGEEIINAREVKQGGRILCRGCVHHYTWS